MAIKKTTREQKTEETRMKISRASWDLMAKYDPDTITVDDICEKAGISKGSFYHLYKSKDDFFILVLSKEREDHLQKHFTLAPAAPLLTQVLDFIRVNLEFNRLKGKDLCVASYISMLKTYQQGEIVPAFYNDTLCALIERGLAEGALAPSFTVSEYYRLFHDWIIGFLIGWSISPHPADEDLYDRILEHMVKAFFAPPVPVR
ncbi:MAG: TetR/AcrR family transcriptional regulator [Spirochaetaceae bacterium]|nr:TetR/AcrR family transcriptional regulator [Spirochaetaceae bacterium]